ncbi:MAG: hypothetical protein JSS75_05580 [Bacteroidetes bacterium]|nr:hypothetical protein [Bacteroidota bacterium]
MSLPSNGSAKWKLIARMPSVDPHFIPVVNACYFFNDQRGIIGIDGVNGIWRTYDGGNTWSQSTIPQGYEGLVNDILMVDSLHGYAVVEDQFGSARGLWRTIDGGVTWGVMQAGVGQYTSVCKTPAALLLSSRYSTPPISISTDQGLSFMPAGTDEYNDIGFVDAAHGVATGFSLRSGQSYANGLWSSDGGLTWYTNNLYMECWSIYPKVGTPTFFAVGEDQMTASVEVLNVYRSDNYGRNFRVVGVVPTRTTGHVAGVGDVLYVQAWTRNMFPSRYTGLMRSTDGGVTWLSVGGPSNYRDCRFWVGNCHGRTVIAFDENGGVWRTDDGGDGTLHDDVRNPNLQPGTINLVADECTTASGLSILTQNSCQTITIQDISFVDSSDEAIRSGALTISGQPSLPSLLDFGQSDTIQFFWNPAKLSGPIAKTTFLVKIHSVSADSSVIQDTILNVDVTALGAGPKYTLSQNSIKLDSINLCMGLIDTIVTLSNRGCDTLFLNAATLGVTTDWEIFAADGSALSYPIAIPRDSLFNLRLRYRPSMSGVSSNKLTLTVEQLGITRDTIINLAGSAYRTLSVLTSQSTRVPPTSVCTYFDTTLTIRNNSCETLTIDSLLSTDPAFEILGGLQPPISLAANGVLVLTIRFHPQRNIGSSGQIRYHYYIGNDSAGSTTYLAGLGLSGTALLRSSLGSGSYHFPDRMECERGDSVSVVFSNAGCDSMQIVSASLTSVSGSVFGYAIQGSLPITLAPGSGNSQVTVVLDSTGAGTYTAILLVSCRLPNGSLFDTSIQISATINPAPHLAETRRDHVDLGTLPFCSSRFDTVYIENKGCTPITVSSITPNSVDYFVHWAPTVPFKIPAASYDSVIVEMQPTAVGGRGGMLTIVTNDDLAPEKIVNYVASVQPIDHLTLRPSLVNSVLIAGDTARIDIVPDRDWPGNGLRQIDFSLEYVHDLMHYVSTLSSNPNNRILTTPVDIPGGLQQLSVHLTSNSDIVLQKDTPLLSFYLATFLTDTTQTDLHLSNVAINGSDSLYQRCVLTTDLNDLSVTVSFACGDEILQGYIRTKRVLFVKAPRPDPGNAASTIVFPYSVEQAGTLLFEVFDEYGRRVFSDNKHVGQAGLSEFKIDPNTLPSGAYSYVLRYTGDGITSVRGKFVILQ